MEISVSFILIILSLIVQLYLHLQQGSQQAAYHTYYEVIRPYYKTHSKVRIESYFEDGLFNIYTSIFETTPDGISESIDVNEVGTHNRDNYNTYYYKLIEQNVPHRIKSDFVDKEQLPVIHAMFESQRKLQKKNKTRVIHSNKDYITVISFRNHGQILSFYRY